LITKYNISHSLGNEILKLIKKHSKPNFIFPISTKSGKEFLDKMKDPVLNFNKIKLLEYNGIEYFFYFRTIVNAITEIFSNKEIFNASIFNYQEVYNNNKRNFIIAIGGKRLKKTTLLAVRFYQSFCIQIKQIVILWGKHLDIQFI